MTNTCDIFQVNPILSTANTGGTAAAAAPPSQQPPHPTAAVKAKEQPAPAHHMHHHHHVHQPLQQLSTPHPNITVTSTPCNPVRPRASTISIISH